MSDFTFLLALFDRYKDGCFHSVMDYRSNDLLKCDYVTAIAMQDCTIKAVIIIE